MKNLGLLAIIDSILMQLPYIGKNFAELTSNFMAGWGVDLLLL